MLRDLFCRVLSTSASAGSYAIFTGHDRPLRLKQRSSSPHLRAPIPKSIVFHIDYRKLAQQLFGSHLSQKLLLDFLLRLHVPFDVDELHRKDLVRGVYTLSLMVSGDLVDSDVPVAAGASQ